MLNDHHYYMAHALDLAQRGCGWVNPNPMVGAVIVRDGRIIGEGYHHAYGQPHAEVEALRDATESPRGATVYVTLEPCSHFGQTPPCADALIRAEVDTVVVAMLDPNPLVSGRGVKRLEQAGIRVIVGIEQEAAEALNRRFVHYITTGTPLVVMKTAMTLDGKIATHTGDSRWVSGDESRHMVHELRQACQAIMVGINTVLSDNPRLDCRLERSVRQPVKVIVDSHLRMPLDARLWDGDADVIIATTNDADEGKAEALRAGGATVIRTGHERVDLPGLMRALGERGIDSVLLEGGATLNGSALTAGVVQEVWSFIAPKLIGGSTAPTPIGGDGLDRMSDALPLHGVTVDRIGDDLLVRGYIRSHSQTLKQS